MPSPDSERTGRAAVDTGGNRSSERAIIQRFEGSDANMSDLHRRTFLQGLAAAGGLCCAPGLVRAAAGPELTVTPLRGGASLVQGAGANLVVVEGGSELLLVDCGGADAAPALDAILRERWARKPVRTLINTHWHLNHTGANERLRRAGAEIVAHENTKLWMTAPILSRWNGTSFPPRAREALPTRTFYTTDRFAFGDETVESGYVQQAHTDGDIYVRLAKANVLITGGLFVVGQYPQSDPATMGWIGGMVNANAQLLKLVDDDTIVVPGLGPAQRRQGLADQLAMMTTVRDRLYTLLKEGRDVNEMLAAKPTKEFDERWGDPVTFIRSAHAGLNIHYRQVPGIV